MTSRMDWNDQPLHRVLTLQTRQVKAPAEVLLSELGMHISRERVKHVSIKVSRHSISAVSVGFYLFQVSCPQVLF